MNLITQLSDHTEYWISAERDKHINNDYSVTVCMLCVITHIREDVFKNSNIKLHIQVNTVIKTLFPGSSEKEFYVSHAGTECV